MFATVPHGPVDQPVLIVPGLNNSGPDHLQSLWERERADCRRVELGHWSAPQPSAWVGALHEAIIDAGVPVVLVAHSLGCYAVASWAAEHGHDPTLAALVAGAMLVAPPWLDDLESGSPLATFSGRARTRLPFPGILVASRNDPYAQLHQWRTLATKWGTRFADAGRIGHIIGASGIGSWPFGEFLLELLLRDRRRQCSASVSAIHLAA